MLSQGRLEQRASRLGNPEEAGGYARSPTVTSMGTRWRPRRATISTPITLRPGAALTGTGTRARGPRAPE